MTVIIKKGRKGLSNEVIGPIAHEQTICTTHLETNCYAIFLSKTLTRLWSSLQDKWPGSPKTAIDIKNSEKMKERDIEDRRPVWN